MRQTVSGYRLPTLEGELAGARMALEAAGIEADLASERRSRFRPRPRRCSRGPCARARRTSSATATRVTASIRILPGLVAASAEVVDDGRGANGGRRDGGHGLAGLRERAERLGGEVDAGTGAAGGFRLRVSVPPV